MPLEDTLHAPLLDRAGSNLRCLSGPPCCCSARGPTGLRAARAFVAPALETDWDA
jgi:hypothetical protein